MQSINLDRREALKSFNKIAILGFGGFMLLKQNLIELSLENEAFATAKKFSSLQELKEHIYLNINLDKVCKEAFVYEDYNVLKKYFLNPSLYYSNNELLEKEFKLDNKTLNIKAPKSFIKALENIIKYDNNSKTLTGFMYQKEFVPNRLDV
ncbi:hypothetical protein B6S12_10700 [Helicobacter valdiviensis]|uniref:Uncharacterized protein n=1 Tax=Helicobacter valdiviensis TaxID=1458358 RepID=A0A2W6MRE3_9HELI|nr:hypothetical protein [Helicobacter valdiviensis]PZT47134.1 hypothetical protein B6S12_10700 [Helicobacter valdiviensis]